jgi:hypothetical protein
LNLGYTKNNNIIIPKNVKKLCIFYENNLINNLPEHIETLVIYFNSNKNNKIISNLPLTIKEIIINDEKHEKYIKIPFGAILTIKNT